MLILHQHGKYSLDQVANGMIFEMSNSPDQLRVLVDINSPDRKARLQSVACRRFCWPGGGG